MIITFINKCGLARGHHTSGSYYTMHYYKSVNGGALMHTLAALHVAHIAVIELLEFLNLIYRRYMVGYMTLFLFF